jgi:integrase/recombinase XerD
LLELLRDWWRIARPQVWMFPGRDRINPMTTRQLNRACHIAADLAGLPNWVTPHTLRHYVAFRTMSRTFRFNVVFRTKIFNPPRHSPAPSVRLVN